MSDVTLPRALPIAPLRSAEGNENADGDDRQNHCVLSHRLAVFLGKPRLQLRVQLEHSISPWFDGPRSLT